MSLQRRRCQQGIIFKRLRKEKNDRERLDRQLSFFCSYKLRIGGGHMGIGAQVAFFNQKIDGDGFRPLQQGDEVLDGLDE